MIKTKKFYKNLIITRNEKLMSLCNLDQGQKIINKTSKCQKSSALTQSL